MEMSSQLKGVSPNPSYKNTRTIIDPQFAEQDFQTGLTLVNMVGDKSNQMRGLSLIKQAADANNPKALCWLGEAHRTGITLLGIKKDLLQAEKFLFPAFILESEQATTSLREMYAGSSPESRQKEPDTDLLSSISEFFSTSGKTSNSVQQIHDGSGGYQSEEVYTHICNERNNPSDMLNKGDRYLEENFFNEAINAYQKVKSQSIPEVNDKLIKAYLGQGTKAIRNKAEREAMIAFQQAVKLGSTSAELALGMLCLKQAKETKINPQKNDLNSKGFKHLLSARQKESVATYLLAALFLQGKILEKNITVALNEFTLAEITGNGIYTLASFSTHDLAIANYCGFGAEHEVEIDKCLQAAADTGNEKAKKRLEFRNEFLVKKDSVNNHSV